MSTISNSTGSAASRNELNEQYRAQQNEKEEIKDRHETEINQLKKSYASEKSAMEDRFVQSTQDEKTNHYDQLRNTKAQLQKEERRLEEQRRAIVGTKQSELNRDAITVEHDGNAKVNELKSKYAAAEEYERNRATVANEEVHTRHKQTAENIIKDSNQRIDGLREQKETELVAQKSTYAESSEQIKGHYDGLRLSTEQQYSKEFKEFQQRATQDLDQRKIAGTLAVQSYADRQSDPFYHLNRFQTTLDEYPDAYVLRVKVPEYERDLFKIQVSGQEIQLNGVRTYSEKAEVEPGRWVSTSSHQNITERVPLNMPVDGRSMTVQGNGEWVEYTLPKYGPNRRMNEQHKTNAVANGEAQDASMTRELEFKNTLQKPTIPGVSKA